MNTTQKLPGNYPIASSIIGFVEIVETPIVAVIYKNQSSLIVGSNMTVELNPGTYSVDRNRAPDEPLV